MYSLVRVDMYQVKGKPVIVYDGDQNFVVFLFYFFYYTFFFIIY